MSWMVDQYGKEWHVEDKEGTLWARGFSDEMMPCVRRVIDGTIVIDLSKPNAYRHLIDAPATPPALPDQRVK